jgi:outer membrane protease
MIAKRVGFLFIAVGAMSNAWGQAQAADLVWPRPEPLPAWQAEVGARYWYSSGRTALDLYGIGGDAMVSRLTYKDAKGHAAEAFGRFDHLTTNLFVKGYVGLGKLANGQLNDEDFPPDTDPYSSTLSDLDDGKMTYASIDVGYDVWNSRRVRVGAFVGYHYFRERLDAMGCRQIATSTICDPAQAASVKVISQDSRWHSLRLGVASRFELADRLSLAVDAAWVPYTWFSGEDTHWLRIGAVPGDFTGPVPDTGRGHGYQLEAVMSYLVSDALSVGVGGRIWSMTNDTTTHFDGHIVGIDAQPQPSEWTTRRYGVFVQASYKFGSGAPAW